MKTYTREQATAMAAAGAIPDHIQRSSLTFYDVPLANGDYCMIARQQVSHREGEPSQAAGMVILLHAVSRQFLSAGGAELVEQGETPKGPTQ